jgi:diguanylate cyclase (GGDEF)-like protein
MYMDFKSTIVVCLFLSCGLTLLMALCGTRRLQAAGAKAYIGLMLSVAVYSLGYALELSSTTLDGIIVSLRIEYLGIPFIPAFWLILALQYTGVGKTFPRWVFSGLFGIPLITFILHFTNDFHHLYYESLSVNSSAPFPLADITKGIWYHINIFYLNICILAGNILFFRIILRSMGSLRKQAVTMFASSLIPWVGNFIYQSGLTPYGIDIVPITLALTGPSFAIALFRFRLFDVVPIARETVFEIMYDPVLIMDSNARLADFNNAAAAFFPELCSDRIGCQIKDVCKTLPAQLIESNCTACQEIAVPGHDEPKTFEIRSIPITSPNKQNMGKLVILHDVTSHQRYVNTLRDLATQDGLTGIANRRHFLESSHKEIERAQRYTTPVSFILIDLDHFKKINDTYGHQAGDAVLQSSVSVFRNALRPSDILGRYGGEEFAVLLPQTLPDDAIKLAERLRGHLEKHVVEYNGQSLHVTASFGVSGMQSFESEDSVNLLIKNADQALYKAKKLGRNRVSRG